MNIEKTVSGTTALIRPVGWLDTKSAPELSAVVDSLDPSVESVELDLGQLEYISSAGLRLIVAIYKKVGQLTVTNVPSGIMDVFRMTGFDKKLNIQ